jgi:hypothetical protein
VFEGTPADLVAARSTLTGQHLAAFVGNRPRPVEPDFHFFSPDFRPARG